MDGGRRDGTVLLCSGFGSDGVGGVFALHGEGRVEVIDEVATTGLAARGDGAVRLLRATADAVSTAELLVYDELGLAGYRRLDGVRDPHDVLPVGDAHLITSSYDDAVFELDGTGLRTRWAAGGEPDAWHVNSVATDGDGRPHLTAFGRLSRHRAWVDADDGVLQDLDGRLVCGGLAHPHSLRWTGRSWMLCESKRGRVIEVDPADGSVVAAWPLGGYLRGLALDGDRLHVGRSAVRGARSGRRAEVLTVDRAGGAVLDRHELPCAEIYDVVLLRAAAAEGLRRGFAPNGARRHGIAALPGAGPASQTPAATGGTELPVVALEADPGTTFVAGEQVAVTCRVTNLGAAPLATTVDLPLFVASRWAAGPGQAAIDGVRSAITRLVEGGATIEVVVYLDPPAAGTWLLTVAALVEDVAWLDLLDSRAGRTTTVSVVAADRPALVDVASSTGGAPGELLDAG